MSYTTKNDILAKWETKESKAEAREIADIRKDIATARAYVSDALDRYKKAKLRLKSKKQAQEDPFADLAPYTRREQIRDDYGWEIITEKEMDRLMALWDLREKGQSQDGVYRDRVTDMLERAMNSIGDEYQEHLFDYDQKRRQMEKEAETIARENNERTWQREVEANRV